MISVNEAIERVKNNTVFLSPVFMPLQRSVGLVLAEDIIAGINLPAFDQSSMDGYAFRFADYNSSNKFRVVGEAAAGDNRTFSFESQEAVRIFTGAPVPEGLDTVVMQEKTEVNDNHVIVLDESLVAGSNVRPAGVEIKKGELALANETLLTPAAVGFLAGLGVTEVTVYPNPVVHIIVTGKELQQPGTPLQRGQVYESNGIMLRAALEQLHIRNITIASVGDDLAETTAALHQALETADLILITGGVSVGNYDFVVQAAEECGVEKLFHKVAQRPGKPLYCGVKDECVVFGLPGNPASVLSCFYNYVVIAIEKQTGKKELIKRNQLPLQAGIHKSIPLRQFLKAVCTDDGVLPLPAQESFRLSSFSVANCLIDLPEETHNYQKGDVVEVLLIPYL
jgi:molybdopterin molybdotransferase